MTTIFIAFNKIAIGTAYFLFYAGSVFTGYVLGRIFFNEKLTSLKAASLLIGLIGLILIYSIGFESNKVWFYILANIAGIGSAIWNVFSKKISQKYSTSQIVFVDSFLIAILSLFFSLLVKEKFIFPAFTVPWISNILFALSSLITSYLIVYGFKYVEASLGSMILLLEVLFGIFFSYLFFHETVSFGALFGGGLVILAILLPNLSGKIFRKHGEL